MARLVRNTLYNLATQGVLLLLALATMPVVVKGLSVERFGLLSLIWVLIGYFSLLDLGISRANAKFLAEALAVSNGSLVRSIVWNSLGFGLIVGIGSGILLAAATPILLRALNLTGPLADQASRAFLLSAVGLAFVVEFGIIRGIHTAYQRFDLINIFQGGIGIAQWLGAALLVVLGAGLDEIVILTVTVRLIVTMAAFLTLPRLVEHFFEGVRWDSKLLRKMLGYGGWVTVSQLISPLYLYLDRFFVGMLLSLTAVTYYTVPQEGLSRLLIVPLSLTAALFPVMSGESAFEGSGGRSSHLYGRAVKYLLLAVLPLTLLLIAAARWVLVVWMGEAFADAAQTILQILAAGLFFNSMSQVPAMALQAHGRPDLVAKFHLIEFPLMVGLNIFLLPRIGVVGAAIAWSIRVIVDAVLLFSAARRTLGLGYQDARGPFGDWSIAGHLLFAVASVGVILMVDGSLPKILCALTSAIVYAVATWKIIFNDADRRFFLDIRARLFGAA